MKKITILTLMALSSFALAKGQNSIHVQHHGKVANIPSDAPIMTRQAAATRHAIRVLPLNLNQRGIARITGSIRGLGMASYRFYGQAGQQVRISPIGNNYSMLFGLFDQNRGMNFGTTHILPTTGEYEVRIVQTRKNAARNRKYYRYDANVYLGNVGSRPVAQTNHSTPTRIRSNSRQDSVNATESYETTLNTTPDGSRRVVSTNMPIDGQRTGKISALPRQNSGVVRENVTTRHVNYHNEPVVSYLKHERKAGKKQSTNKKKSFSTTYRCQGGSNLQIIHQGSTVTVKNKKLTVNLKKNVAQSQGANQIYTGNGGFLHLIKSRKSTTPEVLSFEYKGKTLAFGCK